MDTILLVQMPLLILLISPILYQFLISVLCVKNVGLHRISVSTLQLFCYHHLSVSSLCSAHCTALAAEFCPFHFNITCLAIDERH